MFDSLSPAKNTKKSHPQDMIFCVFGRGGENRTPIKSFGDSYSTIERRPYVLLLDNYSNQFFVCQSIFSICILYCYWLELNNIKTIIPVTMYAYYGCVLALYANTQPLN